MTVYVKIIEGTPYLGDKEWYDVAMSEKEWLALDNSLLYSVEEGKLIVKGQETLKEPEEPVEVKLTPPLPLAYMLDQAGCTSMAKIDALWDAVINNDRTKADEYITKEAETRKEHERLTKEFEAAL